MKQPTPEEWDKLYDFYYEMAQDMSVDEKYNALCEMECGEYLTALDILIGVNGDNDTTYDDFCDYVYGVDFASHYAIEKMAYIESFIN